MPRMPKPDHNCAPIPVNTDINLKLKVLEDRLKNEFAPRDLMLLKEARIIEDGSFIYIYNPNETDLNKKLQRILINDVTSIIAGDVKEDVKEDLLKYKIVRNLPLRGTRNTIYLVPSSNISEEVAGFNEYDEYLWIEQLLKYEKLGYTKIDLSAYRKAAEQDIIDNSLRSQIANETAERQNKDNALLSKINNVNTNLNSHINDKSNPHSVTKAQIGLGNVDNTRDIDKPISNATRSALNGKQDNIPDLDDIRAGATSGANAVQADNNLTDAEIEAIWNTTEGN